MRFTQTVASKSIKNSFSLIVWFDYLNNTQAHFWYSNSTVMLVDLANCFIFSTVLNIAMIEGVLWKNLAE